MGTLNIVFQFGEFISEGISKPNYTIWIPVLTFIAGFIINDRIKKNETLVNAIEAKTFLLTSTQSLIKAIYERSKSIKSFHRQIQDKNVTSIFHIQDTIGFHLNVDLFDRVKIYSSLITHQKGNLKLKSEALDDFYNRIEKLRFIIEQHDSNLKEFFAKSDLRTEEIDKAIHDVQKLWSSYAIKNMEVYTNAEGVSMSRLTSPLLTRIDEIIGAWQAQPNFKNYYIKSEHFFKPLQKIIKEKKLSEFTIELTTFVMNGVNSYFLYEQNRTNFEYYLKFQVITLNTCSRKLIKSFNYLYSQKMRKTVFFLPYPRERKYDSLLKQVKEMKYFIYKDNKVEEVDEYIYDKWIIDESQKYRLEDYSKIKDETQLTLETKFFGALDKDEWDNPLPFRLFIFIDGAEIKDDGIAMELKNDTIEHFSTYEAMVSRRQGLIDRFENS